MKRDADTIARFMAGDMEDMDLYGYSGDQLRAEIKRLRDGLRRVRELTRTDELGQESIDEFCDVMAYVREHGLDTLLGNVPASARTDAYATVDPAETTPYAPDFADLVRLHRLILERKVTTVLEFGCGYSTVVMAHALAINRERHGEYVAANLRRANAFEIHSVDDMPEFAAMTRTGAGLRSHMVVTDVRMTTFAGRICTEYDALPNICPDLIYLDGPSQHSVASSVNNIHTRHADRLPMACDILKIEHFLLPGTLIVVDGRTANARFLRCNLQRKWQYLHDEEADVHTFEMIEPPLGKLNEKQIRFCLGADWVEWSKGGLR